MSNDTGLIWVDVTEDFDPVDYAEAFADDDVLEALQNAESLEEQLICLYENGYLSKRDGRIQFMLPEDVLHEEGKMPWRARAQVAGAKIKEYGQRVKGAYQGARKGGRGRASAAMGAGKAAWRGLGAGGQRAAKIGGGLALGALAARALYKKMKARRAAKQEGLDDTDLEFLINEAELLGIELESLEDLSDALDFGELADEILDEAEEEGLTENYSDEDILDAVLNGLDEEDEDYDEDDLEEAVPEWMKKAGAAVKSGAGRAAGAVRGGASRAAGAARGAVSGMHQAGYAGARDAAYSGSRLKTAAGYAKGAFKTKTGKAAALGLAAGGALAGRALYKKMKARKDKKESMGEALNEYDLQRIITDAEELGFEFESYEDLLDALLIGEAVDEEFFNLAGEDCDDLTEDLEDEVVEAILADIDEAAMDRLKALGAKLKRGVVHSAGYTAEKAKKGAAWAAEKAKSGGKAVWGGASRGASWAKEKGKAAGSAAASAGRSGAAWAKGNKGKAAALGAGAALAAGGAAYAMRKRKQKKAQQTEGVVFEQNEKEELGKIKRRLKTGAKVGAALGALGGAARGALVGKILRPGNKRAMLGSAALGAVAGGGSGAIGGAGYGAAYHALRQKMARKKSAKKESLEFTGYRSSAQGSVYESVEPIPYGTGNRLYARAQSILRSQDGQIFLNGLEG